MDLGLRGRAAFVGGAGRGIGRAIAERLAAEGADVALCARDPVRLEEAAAAVAGRGVRAVPVTADLATEQAAEAVASAADRLGRLDVLVVNTGGPPQGMFDELDDSSWHLAHERTLMSGVRMVRGALPALRRSDAAAVLFVSSSTIRQPVADLVLSNAVRASAAGLAKSLANELAPAVRVNTLMPGQILTERSLNLSQRRADEGGRTVEEQLSVQAARIPLRRLGSPDEFARVAVFLCSPAASYVTGTVLACDGGLIQVPL